MQALLDAECLGLDQLRGRLTQQALAAMGLEAMQPQGRADGHTLLATAAGNGQVASIKVRAMGEQAGEPAACRGAGNAWRLRHSASVPYCCCRCEALSFCRLVAITRLTQLSSAQLSSAQLRLACAQTMGAFPALFHCCPD
jgi:hypothetical protein